MVRNCFEWLPLKNPLNDLSTIFWTFTWNPQIWNKRNQIRETRSHQMFKEITSEIRSKFFWRMCDDCVFFVLQCLKTYRITHVTIHYNGLRSCSNPPSRHLKFQNPIERERMRVKKQRIATKSKVIFFVSAKRNPFVRVHFGRNNKKLKTRDSIMCWYSVTVLQLVFITRPYAQANALRRCTNIYGKCYHPRYHLRTETKHNAHI